MWSPKTTYRGKIGFGEDHRRTEGGTKSVHIISSSVGFAARQVQHLCSPPLSCHTQLSSAHRKLLNTAVGKCKVVVFFFFFSFCIFLQVSGRIRRRCYYLRSSLLWSTRGKVLALKFSFFPVRNSSECMTRCFRPVPPLLILRIKSCLHVFVLFYFLWTRETSGLLIAFN